MKAVALTWLVLASACSFDRTPLSSAGGAPALSLDAGTTLDAALPAPRDAGLVSLPASGAGGKAGSGGASGAAGSSDDRDAGSDPPPVESRCSESFCPLAKGGAKSCCTTADDVKGRLAREPGLCGLELSQVDAVTYGSGCWQRERLGIIDDRCPDLGEELGCCADDGQCGTNNASQMLGCRHAPVSPVRACGDTAPQNSCDPTGSYGLRVSVDTTWDGRTGGLTELTDDGRGPIQIYVLADVQRVDPVTKHATTKTRVCGVSLPPFYSTTLCESYQPVFPNSIWESAKVPVPSLEGQYECGTQGCVMSLGPTTYQLGIRLDNPEATWPTADETLQLSCPTQPDDECFPDDDDDGNPGVQVNLVSSGKSPASSMTCASGYDYRAAPMSENPAVIFNGVRRANRLWLGIRARVGASLRFRDDCQTAAGSGFAQYINSRATGCYVEPGTFDVLQTIPAGAKEPCTGSEIEFIDKSMPVYHALSAGETPTVTSGRRDGSTSPGPTVSVVRFGATGQETTCDQVRSAPYGN